MALRIKGSHIAALVIAGAVAGWMVTGDVVVGGQANSANATPPPAERASEEEQIFKVRYVSVEPEIRPEVLLVRGRTEADTVVAVRSETRGTLEKRFVEKGDRVKVGDLVCQLERGTRESAVSQATATLEQATFDYEGAVELRKKGYASETRVKALKATMDAAAARLRDAEWELSHTDIIATADGVVQDPIAETGTNLAVGDLCITLINPDPMMFIGQVSERQVADISVGDPAKVTLISGETVDGIIRYISPSADAATRTFRTEIEIPNPEKRLRDGLTAAAHIHLEGSEAYRIKPSWLTLDDDGIIGVRVVDNDNVVDFKQLAIVAHTPETMWVTGLEPNTRVITVGQDYVIAGQTVEPVPVDMTAETLKAETKS